MSSRLLSGVVVNGIGGVLSDGDDACFHYRNTRKSSSGQSYLYPVLPLSLAISLRIHLT